MYVNPDYPLYTCFFIYWGIRMLEPIPAFFFFLRQEGVSPHINIASPLNGLTFTSIYLFPNQPMRNLSGLWVDCRAENPLNARGEHATSTNKRLNPEPDYTKFSHYSVKHEY